MISGGIAPAIIGGALAAGGSLLGGLFGGGGSQGYRSPNLAEYERKAKERAFQRLGPSSKPLTGAEGVREATAGFDFTPQQEAINRLRERRLFNFKGLPEEFGAKAYERGAKDIRREGAGQLEKLRETVGPRRLGLLADIGSRSQRATGENLAGLRSDIGLETMKSDVDLGVKEQEAQADEDRLQAESLGFAGRGKLGQEAGLLEGERGYRDQAMNYLMDLFSTTMGESGASQRAGTAAGTSRRGQTLGALGNIFGSYLGRKR